MDGSFLHSPGELASPVTVAPVAGALVAVTLAEGKRFRVRSLRLDPGRVVSSHSHLHRAEHWTVVQGTARVTLGGNTSLFTENQSIHVPLRAVHRLENPGRVPMLLIEVQSGTCLAEDDIPDPEDRPAPP